jgi:hypothetical protein
MIGAVAVQSGCCELSSCEKISEETMAATITAAELQRLNDEFWARPGPHLVQAGLAFAQLLRSRRQRGTAQSAIARREKMRARDERIIASPLPVAEIAAAEKMSLCQVYRVLKRPRSQAS